MVAHYELSLTDKQAPGFAALRRHLHKVTARPDWARFANQLRQPGRLFFLALDSAATCGLVAPMIQRIFTSQGSGGGPTHLLLSDTSADGPVPLLQRLGPWLAGTSVASLELVRDSSRPAVGDWGAIAAALPRNVTVFDCVYPGDDKARELLRRAPPHELTVVLSHRRAPMPVAQQRALARLCAPHRPRLRLRLSLPDGITA